MTITIHNISKLLEIINLVKKGNKSNSSKVKIGFEQKGIVEGVNYSFFEEISDFCELVSLIEIDDGDYIITELGNKFLENTDSLDSKRNFLILINIIILAFPPVPIYYVLILKAIQIQNHIIICCEISQHVIIILNGNNYY